MVKITKEQIKVNDILLLGCGNLPCIGKCIVKVVSIDYNNNMVGNLSNCNTKPLYISDGYNCNNHHRLTVCLDHLVILLWRDFGFHNNINIKFVGDIDDTGSG